MNKRKVTFVLAMCWCMFCIVFISSYLKKKKERWQWDVWMFWFALVKDWWRIESGTRSIYSRSFLIAMCLFRGARKVS